MAMGRCGLATYWLPVDMAMGRGGLGSRLLETTALDVQHRSSIESPMGPWHCEQHGVIGRDAQMQMAARASNLLSLVTLD